VSGDAAVVWDDALAAYDFGAGHPLAPIRVQLAMHLVRDLGLLDADHVTVLAPDEIDDSMLETVHSGDYVAAVRRSSEDPSVHDVHRGLGTDDVPTFAGMHEASRAVCGATLAATRAVLEGRALHAVNLAGGLHHAMPDAASGFCVYNDIAISIQWLLDHGVERVAYVDVDVHHGDGVQAAVWDDPRVLTISVHESGRVPAPTRAPASRWRSAAPVPWAPWSTSRCRPARATRGGFAPSTAWCPRSSSTSPPRSW
jgi:acetoin utilization protein AcuC